MDFTERYHRTLFPGIATVCGIDLPRLTLWRVEALRAVGSKFVLGDGNAVITPEDLTLAIACLFCEYPDIPKLKPTWKLRRETWRMKASKERFVAECRKFTEYLTIYSLRPELWEQSDKSAFRAISAPSTLSQVVTLMEIGMTHSEAWNTSPALAQWLITTHAERQSDKVRFVREDDAMLIHFETDDMTEEEIIQLAKRELGGDFERWYNARKEAMNVNS